MTRVSALELVRSMFGGGDRTGGEEFDHRREGGAQVGKLYYRLERADGRLCLVPKESRRAAASAFAFCAGPSFLSKAGFSALSSGVLLGLGALLLRETEAISALPESIVCGVLDLVNADGCLLSIRLDLRGPEGKPVIAALDRRGEHVCFVKIGWSPVSRRGVRTEKEALERIKAEGLRHGRVPTVLGYLESDGFNALATRPMLMRREALGRSRLSNSHLRILEELGRKEQDWCAIASLEVLDRIDEGVVSLGGYLPVKDLGLVSRAAGLMRSRHSRAVVPIGWRHGDFAPWNLGTDPRDGSLVALDLENFSDHAPAVGDFVSYFSWIRDCRKRHRAIYVRAWLNVKEYCTSVGIRVEHFRLLHLLYALEVYVSKALAWRDSGLQLAEDAAEELRDELDMIDMLTGDIQKGRW